MWELEEGIGVVDRPAEEGDLWGYTDMPPKWSNMTCE